MIAVLTCQTKEEVCPTHEENNTYRPSINACPSGQVVYIPPGTYRLTNGISLKEGTTPTSWTITGA